MPSVDPVPSSPASDDGSLDFYSSSEEVSTPIERVPTAAIDGAKGDASVGVAVHSPPAMFIGTPFATGTGNTLFEYPFPPTRPALSASSSISSAASSVFGPPSPSTRAKYIPRLAQKQSSSVRRRLSGNSPPAVRIPPRLRTDSAGSVGSVQSTADEPMPKTAPGTSAPRPLPLFRLRDRSGSLGVLPIQLPPPSIATMGLGAPSASPMSPAALVDAMASTGLGVTMTPRSEGEVGDEQAAQAAAAAAATEKRRASMPALFTPRLGEDSGSDSGLDREDVDDIPS